MPTFFDLDKYVSLWRSRILIHIYTEKFQRGYFCFYNMERKKQLYVKGKKEYEYGKPTPNFRGRFTNHYVVDEKQYRKRKKESLEARESKRIEDEIKREVEEELFQRVMAVDESRVEKLPHKLKMDILGMPSSTYFWKMKQYNEMKDL